MGDSSSTGRWRASDADREAVADQLRAHYEQGRLDTEELLARLDQVYAARYTDELGAPLAELPGAVAPSAVPAPFAHPPFLPPGVRPGTPEAWALSRRAARQAPRGSGSGLPMLPVLLLLVLVLVAVSIPEGGFPALFLIWPVLALSGVLRRSGPWGHRGR